MKNLSLPKQRRRRGSAMVEFAVMSPLLLMLLGGAMDFSRVFYHGMGLNNAARAGVQYALTKPNQMYDYTGMQDAARQAQPDLTGMTVTASMYCTSTPSHENDADDDELSTAEVVPCPTSGYARQYRARPASPGKGRRWRRRGRPVRTAAPDRPGSKSPPPAFWWPCCRRPCRSAGTGPPPPSRARR